MTKPAPLPMLFQCVRMPGMTTVAACVRQHAERAPSACRDCEMGEAHARGELPSRWSNGAPLLEKQAGAGESLRMRAAPPPAGEVVGRDPKSETKPAPPKNALRELPPERTRSIPKKPPGRPPATYTLGTETLTAAEWAARPEIVERGLSAAVIRMRRNNGWGDERVLTTPLDVKAAGRMAPSVSFDGLAPHVARALDEIIREHSLTTRHGDALVALVRGISRADLAKHMGANPNTVKSLITAMVVRLGVPSTADAVRMVLSRAAGHVVAPAPTPEPEAEEPAPTIIDGRFVVSDTSAESPPAAVTRDRELAAIEVCLAALEPLSSDAQHRVLSYLDDRLFGRARVIGLVRAGG